MFLINIIKFETLKFEEIARKIRMFFICIIISLYTIYIYFKLYLF